MAVRWCRAVPDIPFPRRVTSAPEELTRPHVVARKADLRRRCRAIRAAVDADERAAVDHAIVQRLRTIPELSGARRVLAYAAFGDEPSLDEVIRRLLLRDVQVQLPFVDGTARHLGTAVLTGLGDVVPGRWGIREPAVRPPAAGSDRPGRADPPDIVLVPGLAFDRDGGRLGYGRGFYDRLLHDLDGVPAIGVCPDALIVNRVPTGPADHPVDAVVTERAVYRRRSPHAPSTTT